MFSVGDVLVYYPHGVCKISSINDKFYVFEPVSDNRLRFFVPVNNDEFIRKNIRKCFEEKYIRQMMKDAFSMMKLGFDKRRISDCKELCRGFFARNDYNEYVLLINVFYLFDLERQGQKKTFKASEERFIKEAQKFVTDEIAFVMKTPLKSIDKSFFNQFK